MGPVKISFLGDICLNNRYNDYCGKVQNPFKNVYDELMSSDLTIGNLECLSKGEFGENELKKPRLKVTYNTLNLLKKIPVSVVTLAHNHIYDNLEDGYAKTTDFLKKNKIEFIGAGSSTKEIRKPLLKLINGIKLAFLNYVTDNTNPSLPADAKIQPNFFSLDKAKHDIKQLKNESDFLIVLLHWGGRVENGLYPDWNQPKIARQLIDSGCDLIIGHHSHTIQPYEKYKGKYIFYSLGNFCFDDIIFENRLYNKLSKRNKETIIINVCFTKTNYSVTIKTYKRKGLSLTPNEMVKYKLYVRNVIFVLMKYFHPLWLLYFFKLRKLNPIHFFLFREKDSCSNKIRRVIMKLFK